MVSVMVLTMLGVREFVMLGVCHAGVPEASVREFVMLVIVIRS